MLKIFGGASRLLSLLSLQDISFCDRASVVSGERQERLQIQWLSEARCQLGIGGQAAPREEGGGALASALAGARQRGGGAQQRRRRTTI